MILADLTIFGQLLAGHVPAVQSLHTELRQKRQLTAPSAVFGQLLAEAEDDRAAQRIREWAAELPSLDEGPLAWLAAGDLAHHLRRHGVHLNLLDSFAVALALRDDLELWSLHPSFEQVAHVVPLRRFAPTGLRLR